MNWLEQQLREKNWSIRELGRRSDINASDISKILSGKRKPTLETYAKISEGLELPLERIFRIAGILPDDEDIDDGPLSAREIWEMSKRLSAEQRKEVLDFLDYLTFKKKRGEAVD